MDQQIVNLALNQMNYCDYGLAAHTIMEKAVRSSEKQTIATRKKTSTDLVNEFAAFAKNFTENRGNKNAEVIYNLINAGYSKLELLNTLVLSDLKSISNYARSILKSDINYQFA